MKMKIGIVCPYAINKHGGVQEVILSLRDGLIAKGHSVKIITPSPRIKGVAEAPEGVIYIGSSTDFRSPMRTTTQVSNVVDNELIDDILAKEKFDILHFHEPWQPLLSRQLLQRSTSVNIATFHSKLPETMMSRTVIKVVTPYLKSVMQYLHELTAVSNSGAEYAAGLTDQPITIIPNGIDLTKYQMTGKPRPAAQKTILFIGRLERRKGAKYLLQAFQLLAQDNPDVRLIIAGDGPERERLEMLADDLKLTNIEFLGFVSEELKMKLLHDTDLLCSPAVYGESFGIVLLEAMATGTVCVAGNNSGYNDVMQGVGQLSLVNPHDTEEFARRLHLLLNEEALRKVWREWAAEYVKQFSYPRIVDQYEELYKEALTQHGYPK
jgi:phosphatidylinositol alpha-mannosyltransferase